MKELIFPSPLRAHYWFTIFGIQLPEIVESKKLTVEDVVKIKEKLLNPLRVPEAAVNDMTDYLFCAIEPGPVDKTKLANESSLSNFQQYEKPTIADLAKWYTALMRWYFKAGDETAKEKCEKLYKEINPPTFSLAIEGYLLPGTQTLRQNATRVQETNNDDDDLNIPIRLEGINWGNCSYSENIYEDQDFVLRGDALDALVADLENDMTRYEQLQDLDSSYTKDWILNWVTELISENVDFSGNWDSEDCPEYDNHETSETELNNSFITDTSETITNAILAGIRERVPFQFQADNF